jgi:hypothetical protein
MIDYGLILSLNSISVTQFEFYRICDVSQCFPLFGYCLYTYRYFAESISGIGNIPLGIDGIGGFSIGIEEIGGFSKGIGGIGDPTDPADLFHTNRRSADPGSEFPALV